QKGTRKDRTRPSGRSSSKAAPPAPQTSAFRAAETSDERTGSAFRAVGGGLSSLARGMGNLTRSATRRREEPADTAPVKTSRATTEPEEEREPADMDGIALTILGLAAVLGASVWLDIAGPIGAAISHGAHLVIGAGALILPVALIALAIALMVGVEQRPGV